MTRIYKFVYDKKIVKTYKLLLTKRYINVRWQSDVILNVFTCAARNGKNTEIY